MNQLQGCRDHLQQLQHQRARLTASWQACLLELQTTGAPPQQSLFDEQAAYDTQLTTLLTELSNSGLKIQTDKLGSLQELSQRLEDHGVRQQAAVVLEQLMQLQHVSESQFEPLLAIQEQANALLSGDVPVTPERMAEWMSLISGDHPFVDLLRWQDASADMNDHEWDRMHDRVANHFGRALATAVGRGRIAAISAAEPIARATPHADLADVAVPMPEPVDEVATPVAEETVDFVPESALSKNRLAQLRQPEPRFVFDFATHGTAMTGVLDSALARLLPIPTAAPANTRLLPGEHPPRSAADAVIAGHDVPADSGVLEAWSHRRGARGERRTAVHLHQTPAAALAEAALVATGEERARCLFRLIDQLLIDDRLDLAYHLMRVLEGQPTARLTPLPTSLIRAVKLSRHVCYPQGELHRHVEDDLKKQQPKRYQELPTEGRLAYEFLCRAAALLPALLCSSTSAVRLLQSFSIEPGLIQLYNYCSRIASYAERLQGRTGEMLQTGDIATGGSQELAALRQAAHEWLTQGLKQTTTYSKSSPLFLHAHWTVMTGTLQQAPEIAHMWSQWQETWLTVHRLLRPVIRGLGSDRTWVKHEIERLTPMLRPSAPKPGETATSTFTEAQSAMRDVLSRAVEFASGWLRLKSGGSSSISNLPVREMEELSSEIRERSKPVLAELRPFAGIQKSPTVRAGAFCLMRVIQRIHSLFESQTALAWREPDIRHLLHAELLKIPCLPLNEQWEPEVDLDVLETELLEHLGHGARDFREAFELQCRQGDHIATGRLLELPVWESEMELQALSKIRQQRIAESRRDLQSDVENLSSELESLAAAEELPEADRPILRRRIERLQSMVSKTLDFPIADIQVQQLRLMLQRRSVSLRSLETEIPVHRSALPAMTNQDRPEPQPAPVEPGETPPESESAAGNAWVMDLLWEDR